MKQQLEVVAYINSPISNKATAKDFSFSRMLQNHTKPKMPIAALTALLLFAAVAAQSPGQAPTAAPGYAAAGPPYVDASGPAAPEDCLTKLFNVSDCLTFVDIGSNLTKPDEPCCPELAGLVESSPQCLCELLRSKGSQFNISTSRALELPALCHVTTPSVSLCSVFGIPVDVPASAPAPSAGEDPSSGTITPSGGPGSGASTISFSAVALALALGAAILTLIFS